MTISNGPLAQLAEQLTLNEVVGSIPTWSTIENEAPRVGGLYVFEKFPRLKNGVQMGGKILLNAR